MKIICRISRYIFLGLVSLQLAACGGGGGGGDEQKLLADFVGNWSGTVVLNSNGNSCPREIPPEGQTITFQHNIAQSLNSPNEVTVTLLDQGVACRDLRADPNSDHFTAVCPDNPLPGFLPGLTCSEQRVWEYRFAGGGFSDVVRTAYVHCFKDGLQQLACPVTYGGAASAVTGRLPSCPHC